MKRAVSFGLILSAMLAFHATQAQASLVEIYSINVGATLHTASGNPWSIKDAGWSYRPTTSFDLAAVHTIFSSIPSGHTPVTIEVYNGSAAGGPIGTALATASYSPTANVLGGVTFSTPLSLVANQLYFIAFKNVNGLGVNLADGSGQTLTVNGMNPGVGSNTVRFNSMTGSNSTGFQQLSGNPIVSNRPVFALYATAVPEPTSIALLGIGTGIMGLGGLVRRRFSGVKGEKPVVA